MESLKNLDDNGKRKVSLLDWEKPVKVVVCEDCDWQFVIQENQVLPHCPHCYKPTLVDLSQETRDQLAIYPPELILTSPFSPGQLPQIIHTFSRNLWFSPSDLKIANLVNRLVLLYMPIWLVDGSVQAIWKAEAGFNYQVLSHQDRFDDQRGGWSSQEIQETRIRWEPRAGKLQRGYQNITAPAMNEHPLFTRQIGQFDLASARSFEGKALPETGWAACLPNRGTKDAWTEAALGFQSSAVKECQQACRADHLRDFTWQPEFSGQNWTLLLMPIYSTFYTDDEGKPQPVLINGQSGKLYGSRRASLRRAQKTSLILAGVAALIFLLSLMTSLAAAVFPLLLTLGGIGIILALLVGLAALAPLFIVWRTNRHSQAAI